MKAIFKHFLATAVLLLISVSMNAEVYSGDCGEQGDNVKWTLDTETGLLNITGSGNMSSIGESPWYSYRAFIINVIIESGVTSIKSFAFSDCMGLTSINISEGVTSIGDSAFLRCSSLTSITIPSSVTSIGYGAFSGCTGLTSVNISEGVTSIGFEAFSDCSSLTSITIPSSVTSIGADAFRGCFGLPVEDNLRYADTYLIEAVDKTLSTYNIKEGTRLIGISAFSGCFGLTSINIPEGVTSIWDYAFSGCSRLTSITIPEGVTSIGRSAFSNCSRLTSINIPEGVTSIEYETFKDCSSLSSISIPESVTSIGADAFYGCSNLTLVNIPENLASIGARAFANTPWYESMPDGIVYINNVLYCLKGKLSSPFELTIKDGTKSISNSALSGCYQLRSVSIPESVTEIGSYAFSGCIGLTSIKIPKSVNSIGDNAFKECIALNEVHISDLSAWCNINFAGYEYTSNPLYLAHHLFLNNNEITDLIIPDEVTKINRYAFVGYEALKTLVIPETMKTIENGAFFHCTELTEVELPDVDIEIGFEVFGECNSLVKPIYNSKQFVKLSETYQGEFVIPESIETICSTAFSYCDKLTKVTIPPSVTSIGRSAFRRCPMLNVIYAQGTTPPALVATGSNPSFDSYAAFLYVPLGCEEAYGTAEGWKKFTKIREKEFGIKDCLLAIKDGGGGSSLLKCKTMTQYSFLFMADEGWKVSSVSFNGSDVTSELAQDGSYTTPALTGDSELNVVFEQDGNEVKEVGEDGQLRVFASGSAVTIQNNGEPQQVSVYTTDGKAVKQTIAERGNTRITLNEGNVYLLKIGERTFKVAM